MSGGIVYVLPSVRQKVPDDARYCNYCGQQLTELCNTDNVFEPGLTNSIDEVVNDLEKNHSDTKYSITLLDISENADRMKVERRVSELFQKDLDAVRLCLNRLPLTIGKDYAAQKAMSFKASLEEAGVFVSLSTFQEPDKTVSRFNKTAENNEQIKISRESSLVTSKVQAKDKHTVFIKSIPALIGEDIVAKRLSELLGKDLVTVRLYLKRLPFTLGKDYTASQALVIKNSLEEVGVVIESTLTPHMAGGTNNPAPASIEGPSRTSGSSNNEDNNISYVYLSFVLGALWSPIGASIAKMRSFPSPSEAGWAVGISGAIFLFVGFGFGAGIIAFINSLKVIGAQKRSGHGP